jgi:hypothetical protein
MPFKEFLELTPVEFYTSLWEREKHEENVVLAQIRTICETIRLQTYHLMNVQLPRGHKIKDYKKLGTFTWERVPKPAQSFEEMKGIMKAMAKHMNKNKKKKGKTQTKKNNGRRSSTSR